MIVVYNISTNSDWVYAVDTKHLQGLRCTRSSIAVINGHTVYTAETQEEAVARFDDLLEALSNDQTVYDMREEVGYWKPKKVAKKPGPKPKAEQSAPAEHTPTPKK